MIKTPVEQRSSIARCAPEVDPLFISVHDLIGLCTSTEVCGISCGVEARSVVEACVDDGNRRIGERIVQDGFGRAWVAAEGGRFGFRWVRVRVGGGGLAEEDEIVF